MKRQLMMLIGLVMAVSGWAIGQGATSWHEVDVLSLPLTNVVGGVLISGLSQRPPAAKEES